MLEISLQKFGIVFRAIVLFVVFAGLLFSCGEGIRLFPFPFTKTPQNISSEVETDEDRNYEKNLHRFENNHTNLQSKIQRGNLQHHWNSAFGKVEFLAFAKLSVSDKINVSLNPQIFKSRLISAALGSRAPPVS